MKTTNRRDFIKNSLLGIIGMGFMSIKSRGNVRSGFTNNPPKIKDYRTLGRTGFKVSDIGTGACLNKNVFRAVLEAGVNFIETSELYNKGNNERMIGEIIRDFDRKKLIIATKAAWRLKEFESTDDILNRANASLERLQTDYIDCYMIHEAENSARVKNRYFHEAMEQLKKEGKVRSVGLSCHGDRWWDNPESMESIIQTAIDDGRFDVAFFPYNYFEPETGNKMLQACHDNNIGTMIMKSNPIIIYEFFDRLKQDMEKEGKKLPEHYTIAYGKYGPQVDYARQFFRKYGIIDMEKIKEGAIQFILANKNVNTICGVFQTFDDVNKYIPLSGTTLSKRTALLLQECREALGFLNCRMGCNLCEKACPNHIPVNTIMRYNYYFTNKHQEKYAMQQYAELQGQKPDVCIDCEGFCEKACPYGVAVKFVLNIAHHQLSMEGPYYA